MNIKPGGGIFPLFFMVISIFINQELTAQVIKLSWKPNPENDIKYYVIYKDTTRNPQIEISKVPATDTTYLDDDIVIGEEYYYRIAAVDLANNVSEFSDEICIVAENSFSINSPNGHLQKIELIQNYPNPFNFETALKFAIAREGEVSLVILDILGRKVRKLVNEYKNVGYYDVKWDGKDNHGKEVSTGIYFCRMQGIGFLKLKKITLTR